MKDGLAHREQQRVDIPSKSGKSIFLQALDLPAGQERQDFLESACGSDTTLLREVEGLLMHHSQASSFLESPPTEVVSPARHDTTNQTTSLGLDFLAPAADGKGLGWLGYHEIEEVIGCGGFGVVLKARDTKLDRIVAIKTLVPSLASSATARQRFVREAKAAAAVNHENVVRIHAVFDEGTVPYLAMELVSGVSLEEKLQQVGTLELRAILRIAMQIAWGLAAAHQQGLVHRDVKPANILLENGIERVKITDFGLARAANEAAITGDGEVAGTPQYMSPEQALGGLVDQRSDLFSLGSVLYAMCTGRSPFRAETTVAALRRVCDDTPRPIREINSEIPEWLVAIIDRLLAKTPNERFQSAAEVADVLSVHLARIQRPAGADCDLQVEDRGFEYVDQNPPQVFFPYSQSHKQWAIAIAALGICLASMLGMSEATGITQVVTTAIRLLTSEGTLVVETDDPTVKVTIEGDGGLVITGAGSHEVRLKPGSYQLKADKNGQRIPLDQELVTITRGNKQIVRVRLERAAKAAAKSSDSLASLVRTHSWPGDDVFTACFSRDGQYYAATGNALHERAVRVWNTTNGHVVAEFRGWALCLFTLDSERLITSDVDNHVHIWNIATGERVTRFGKHPGWMRRSSLSPDGTQLLTGCRDGVVRLWNVTDGTEIGRLASNNILGVPYFCADGKRAITTDDEGVIRLWDLEKRQEIRRWQQRGFLRETFAFCSDGQRFVTLGPDTVHLWDMTTDTRISSQRLAGTITASAFSPDGSRLLYTVESDDKVRLLDLAANKELTINEISRDAYRPQHHMCISPDGRLAAAPAMGVVYLWRLPDPLPPGNSSSTQR